MSRACGTSTSCSARVSGSPRSPSPESAPAARATARPPSGPTTHAPKDPEPKSPPIEPLLPPDGAPNVLVVLLDDVGFGASSAFGGPCPAPAAGRLATSGLKDNPL